jgi:hypothetical protein
VNFPFIHVCSNIPAASAYGIYISQLVDIPELVVPIMVFLIDALNDIYLENNQNIQYIKHSKYRQDS